MRFRVQPSAQDRILVEHVLSPRASGMIEEVRGSLWIYLLSMKWYSFSRLGVEVKTQ